MKTVFLIYIPVLDYEDSEQSYCVCSTREKAQKIVDECFKKFQKIKEEIGEEPSPEDCPSDITYDELWDKWSERDVGCRQSPNDEMFDMYLYCDWERNGEHCLEIKELPYYI